MAGIQLLLLITLASTLAFASCESLEDDKSSEVMDPMHFYPNWQKKVVPPKFVCPAIYGRYPHPNDCSLFYLCRFGWPTLMQCYRGKLYDERKEQCIDRRHVKCHKGGDKDKDDKNKNKDKDKDKEIDEEYPKFFKCPYIWGTFAHPIDCSKYFVCLYNVPTLFQCPGFDLFDDRARRCKHWRGVRCGHRLDRDQMLTSRRPTSRPQTTYSRLPETKVTRHTTLPETTVTRPTRLPETTFITHTTPTKDDMCNTSPETRRPTTRSTLPVTEPTTTEAPYKYGCPFPHGHYPDPEDCSQFYVCNFSIPTLHKCPESTLYDERKEMCLEDKHVRCGDRPGGVGGDEEEPEKKEEKEQLECPYVWGTFPHPDDCSKYIICIYNVPTLFNCRKSELFHAYYRRCLPKDQVTCDYRINPDDLTFLPRTSSVPTTPITTPPTTPTTTTTTTTTTTPTPTTTTARPTTTKLKPNTPPPTDCDEEDVDCIIDDTGDVKGWFDCPKRFGHYPHASSHQLFIHCDNWMPFVKKCADGTAFSPKYLVCMWFDKNNRTTTKPGASSK